MAQKVGSLIISLALESGAFRSGLQADEKELKASMKRIQAVGAKLQGIGETMSLAVTLPMAALAQQAVKAAIESQDALGQVEAALASMGTAAGRTSEQLQALAASEMKKSLFDDDEILRGVTANLLTFGNIAGEQFDRAQAVAIDLATRLKMDLQPAALLVGKALNDPVKGLTALSRAGIQFTEQQKEQIKAMIAAGDAAGAQNIILKELERQFAGSAEAARKANPGAVMQQSLGNALENLGNAILPLLPPITEAIAAIADAFSNLSPQAQKTVVVMMGLAAALGPVLTVVGSLVQLTAPVLTLAGALLKFKDIAGIFANLVPMALQLGRALMLLALNPVGITIMAIAAAVGAVYYAWKNWDKIKPILVNLYNGVKEWLQDKLGSVWNWLMAQIDAVSNAFRKLYIAVVGNSYVPDMVDGIADQMARLESVMVNPAEVAARKTGEAFRAMADEVQPILDRLFPEARALADYRRELAAINRAEKGGMIDAAQAEEARRRLRGLMPGEIELSAGGNLADTLREMGKVEAELARITGAANDNAAKVQVANVRIAKSFKDMAEETVSALQGLANAIKGGGFLDVLGGVVNVLMQFGSIGLFGKKVQANINKPVPGYAGGTNYHPGGLAVVGERGPELVNLPRGASVTPNHALRGAGAGMRVEVVPSPYFDVRVQENIAGAAPAIAQAGAMAGEARVFGRQRRRLA